MVISTFADWHSYSLPIKLQFMRHRQDGPTLFEDPTSNDPTVECSLQIHEAVVLILPKVWN